MYHQVSTVFCLSIFVTRWAEKRWMWVNCHKGKKLNKEAQLFFLISGKENLFVKFPAAYRLIFSLVIRSTSRSSCVICLLVNWITNNPCMPSSHFCCNHKLRWWFVLCADECNRTIFQCSDCGRFACPESFLARFMLSQVCVTHNHFTLLSANQFIQWILLATNISSRYLPTNFVMIEKLISTSSRCLLWMGLDGSFTKQRHLFLFLAKSILCRPRNDSEFWRNSELLPFVFLLGNS